MEIKDIIKARRIELGLTMLDISKEVGVSEATVSRWESGDIANMKRDKIVSLADALNVSPAVIMGWEDAPTKSIYEYYPFTKRGIKIPVLGKVQAGIPIEAIEDILDYEEISEDMASRGEYFALQIRGDSMEPRIKEGDVVIVKRQPIVDSGEIAIVLVNGNDATCKKLVKHTNGVSLVSFNQSYEPMFYTNKEMQEKPITVLGKVVELRGKF